MDYNTPVPPGYSTGLIPRDFVKCPVGYQSFAPAYPDEELIPESDWQRIWELNRANKANLLAVREANYDLLKSLDQNGLGLCWAFSSTKAGMYELFLANVLKEILSAWWVAGKVVNWRDQGYWGSASLAQIVSAGVPSLKLCPSYKSSYDTQECQTDAAKRKVTEWWDGSQDPNKAQKQLVSRLLRNRPAVVDLNAMGHSMCAIDIGSISPLEIIYDNSWGEQGEKGLYRGRGAYARPDGLVIPRVVMAS